MKKSRFLESQLISILKQVEAGGIDANRKKPNLRNQVESATARSARTQCCQGMQRSDSNALIWQ